ncbi:Cytochrome c oxidase subunit 2 [bacterium HR10]|nr:Cytochrome c oxidase subunit 2 [bacterium HR10]
MIRTLRRVGMVLLGAGAMLFLASVVLAWWPARGEERAVTVVARRFHYTPNIVRVRRGDVVTIRLVSEDVHHGLYLDGYEVQTSALPGQDGVVRFVADRTGKFAFRCSVTCGAFHPYMIGYLKVEPDYRFWGATGAVLALFGAAFVAVGTRGS